MTTYKLSPELAQKFADLVYESTGYPATVSDENAVLIADSLKKRIGITHAGAKAILNSDVKEYFVTAEEAAKNPNVKEGYNVPIVVDGEKIGTTGIGGKIEVTKPLVMMTSRLMSISIREERQKEKIQDIIKLLSENVGQATKAMESISGSSQAAAATTEEVAEASEEAVKKVKDTDEILYLSRSTAEQIKLLGLNASIEAARAGQHGRGFSVVSSEMQNLGQKSTEATEKIHSILTEIEKANQKVLGGIQQLSEVSREQTQALEHILDLGHSLENLTMDIVRTFEKEEV